MRLPVYNLVIPTATNFVSQINQGLFLASNRFTTEFANFLPGQTYTDGQLEAKATDLANEVRKDFQAVSSGIKIVESNDEADVTATWEDTFSSSSNRPIYGRAELDLDIAAVRAVIGTPGRTDPITGNTFNLEIPDVAQQRALADLINQRVNNSVWFGLGINISWTDPNTSWAQFIANTMSHELGHTFGLNEAYISPIPTNIPGTAGCDAQGNCSPKDIMRLRLGNDPDLSFHAITLELLKASVGIHPNGDKPISNGLTLWRDNFNLCNGLDNVNGLTVPRDETISVPTLKLSSDSFWFFGFGRIDTYGSIAADNVGNQSRIVTYKVTNDGNAPLIIHSISLEHGNKGFSVIDGDSLIGVTFAPNESKTLSIRFDPTVIGNLEDTLRIENNSDIPSTWEMKLLR